VLDNDPLTVEATAALLTAMGHRPHGAEDGDAARAVLRKDHVDAVLADFRLDTEEDGLGVVASLRAQHPDLPALLSHRRNQPRHPRACPRDGGCRYRPSPPLPRGSRPFWAMASRRSSKRKGAIAAPVLRGNRRLSRCYLQASLLAARIAANCCPRPIAARPAIGQLAPGIDHAQRLRRASVIQSALHSSAGW
jgi:CheY-like chemotaxis protein